MAVGDSSKAAADRELPKKNSKRVTSRIYTILNVLRHYKALSGGFGFDSSITEFLLNPIALPIQPPISVSYSQQVAAQAIPELGGLCLLIMGYRLQSVYKPRYLSSIA